MKAFVSVDLEGLPYIVIPGHLNLKGVQYSEARKIATRLTLTVADELHKNGFEEILVADSHGPMVNLLVDQLPDYVEIIRGFPRPLSMVAGVEGCEVALFIGYHAKAGTAYSTFDHTYSGGAIHSVEINGNEVSEFLMNAFTAGESNVPVILVAGDYQLLEDDVKQFTPWAERITLKRSLGRSAARSFGLGRIEEDLRKGVQRAISTFKENKTRPLVTKTPIHVCVAFKSTYFSDVAELLPQINRIDGLKVEYSAQSMVEVYKIFQVLCLASAGIKAIKSEQ